MDALQYISEGGIITPGETIVYVLIVTLIALVGSNESCLVNSFSFVCYWGFKGLLRTLGTAQGQPEMMLLLYFVSGIAIFVLVNLYYFRRDQVPGKVLGRNSRSLVETGSAG